MKIPVVAVSCQPHQRDRLERLCRYVTRPAICLDRLIVRADGKIQYELKNPFRNGTTLCQRRTGSPIHIGAWWPMDDVDIEGETKVFSRTSGERGMEATFNFCPECGTSVWWGGQTEGDGPLIGLYGIAGGCFADPDFPPPTHSLYERTKHPWVSTPDNTQCFSAMFDDPAVIADLVANIEKRRT